MAFFKNVNNDNSFKMGSEFFANGTISDILREVSLIDDVSEKSRRLESYVHLMKAEMLKIDGFKRELPLCMTLLNDGIKMLNEERLKWKGKRVEPVMADELTLLKNDGIGRAKLSNGINDKKNWLSSAQLWTAAVEYEEDQFEEARNPKSFVLPKSYPQEEKVYGHDETQFPKMPNNLNNRGGAFLSYKRQRGGVPINKFALPVNNGLTLLQQQHVAADVDDEKVEPLKEPSERKQRRCWSPQLHNSFVDALHQLGGAKVATPKQIRELMKVEGLTNDEVKSHLQKYRIHLRKLANSEQATGDLLCDDPSLKLSMAISSTVSPHSHSSANEGSSSKEKSGEKERSGSQTCESTVVYDMKIR